MKGFIGELAQVFDNLSSLSTSTETPEKRTVSDQLLVSLQDARIFLLAFSRIPLETQSSLFSSLLQEVERGLSRLRDGHDIVGKTDELPALFARLLTLCVNAYVMVRFGTHAQDELIRVVGKSLAAQLPAFRYQSDDYYADKCFMGVYSDWEDSELPALSLSSKSMDKKLEENLQRLLKIGLVVGFYHSFYRQMPSSLCSLECTRKR